MGSHVYTYRAQKTFTITSLTQTCFNPGHTSTPRGAFSPCHCKQRNRLLNHIAYSVMVQWTNPQMTSLQWPRTRDLLITSRTRYHYAITVGSDTESQWKRGLIHSLVRLDENTSHWSVDEQPVGAFAGFQASVQPAVVKSKPYYFLIFPSPLNKSAVHAAMERIVAAATTQKMPFIQLVGDLPGLCPHRTNQIWTSRSIQYHLTLYGTISHLLLLHLRHW